MIRPNRLKILYHALVEPVTGDRGAVTDYDQLAPCAGQGYVHAARIG